MTDPSYLSALASRLRDLRTRARRSASSVEDQLILGPGWVTHLESGEELGRLGLGPLLALIRALDAHPVDLFQGIALRGSDLVFERALYATAWDDNLGIDLHFPYGKHDATYPLPSGTLDQFQAVLKSLRDGLSGLVAFKPAEDRSGDEPQAMSRVKTSAVVQAFRAALSTWPTCNPADLWGFVIARAYQDPFNHPAQFARTDLGQSWKRTGGWALEQFMVDWYGPLLASRGIELIMPPLAEKDRLLETVRSRVKGVRLEADKADVLLVGDYGEGRTCFGVVHVKNSFAERRTDDVDMSRALVQAGYCSPLWTMDCKAWPARRPRHSGELGAPDGKRRTAKRVDIEDDRLFSACFSYNRLTRPTPEKAHRKGRIYVCGLANPNDDFSEFISGEWARFRKEATAARD